MSAVIHTHHLSEVIGPRGSTSPQEAQAARYTAKVLEKAGQMPVTEPFISARSAYHPFLFFCMVVLFCSILFWAAGPIGSLAALLITGVALISILLEASFRPNPLRWFIAKERSQNVWASIPSAGEERKKVVIMGHLDSHRSPLVFSNNRWLTIFRSLIPTGIVATVLLIILFGVGLISPALIWRILSIPFLLIILGIAYLMLQADQTEFTPGANDNASGVAIVLSTAERLVNEPLGNTSVIVVCTGCEEVGCYGADAFAREHQDEIQGAYWIAVDSAGGKQADPAYLTSETFFTTARSDPHLLALADNVASSRPELKAFATGFRGAYTEGAIGAKYGFPVITLLSLRRDGALPEWHRPTDVFNNIEKDVLERCENFLWDLLQAVDKDVGTTKPIGKAE